MTVQEIKVGSKVKFNIPYLEVTGFSGLHPEDNDKGTDHVSYILDNPDKVYEVVETRHPTLRNPIVIKDENLGETSFCSQELILVEE